MRYIILDTETTGLSRTGAITGDHGIIEIAAVEILDGIITNNVFHTYVNPGRKIDPNATKIHGITDDMLLDKPPFKDIIEELTDFIKDDIVVIHNAAFDIAFIDKELHVSGYKDKRTFFFVDTLLLARSYFPNEKNTLDALALRVGVTRKTRVHGALEDAFILAKIFLELFY